MAFCSNCGTKLNDGARFCQGCGAPVNTTSAGGYARREFEYAGKIIKCPNCGESLASFHVKCPSCGHEIREAKVSSVVKEFASKLEMIEAQPDPKKKGFIRNKLEDASATITEKEQRKIELIRSFPVPNTKEDMLEFMILATSCISYDLYDSFKSETVPRGQKEVNAAWFSKVQQVYEKAKRSNDADDTYAQIDSLYRKCKEQIKKSKKKGVLKWVLGFGWIPLFAIIVFTTIHISEVNTEKNEIRRLEAIVVEVQEALEDGEYKHALRLAESIEYEEYDDALETEWAVKRDYWIDKVIDTAAENGVTLEYTPKEKEDNLTWDEVSDILWGDDDPTAAPTTTNRPADGSIPTETPHPTAEQVTPIEKGAVYTFGHDEFSLYCATAISDSLIKIEKWGKSLSTQKAFSNEYEVGTFRITDTACGFVWLDGEHTAFEFSLQDDDDWDFKKSQKVVFTLSGIDGDTNKGTNYDENGVCYWYENDDWHEYRAMLLSDNLLKIECWYRGIAIGGFNYGYDVVVIDLNAPVMGFEWTDDEHTAFTITLKDEQNSDLKKGTFVSFTLDK